ncbi:ABC transporter permease [uncultured Ilyobacter sp.]|uniref:ABC transporter permease n=1 Tax=uncultured Ilyobacter sp. TaxID=544433 RepID=UPI0029BFD986|nr:ABC transporter permease [uncultured Ilyobacter sp.]
MKKWQNLENNFLFLGILGGMVALTEFIVKYKDIPSYILPAPTRVVAAMAEQKDVLFIHTVTTVVESLVGFTAAIVLALLMGAMIYPFKRIKKVLYPFLLISQTIPLIAIAPVILIWMGFGVFPKVVIVILICTFPILISFLEGLDQVDRELLDLMRVMRADKKAIFFKGVLPGSLPSIFSGLKIAATYAVMGAVIGEWLGAEKGLGIYMTRAISSFRTDNLFAAIIVVVALSICLFKGVEAVERLVMPWKKD